MKRLLILALLALGLLLLALGGWLVQGARWTLGWTLGWTRRAQRRRRDVLAPA